MVAIEILKLGDLYFDFWQVTQARLNN
jgi:hypothetical protein